MTQTENETATDGEEVVLDNDPAYEITGRNVVKFCARGLVGTGVGVIVNGIIDNNVPMPESRYKTAGVILGSVIVAMMAKDAAKEYTNKQVDEAFEAVGFFRGKYKTWQASRVQVESVE